MSVSRATSAHRQIDPSASDFLRQLYAGCADDKFCILCQVVGEGVLPYRGQVRLTELPRVADEWAQKSLQEGRKAYFTTGLQDEVPAWPHRGKTDDITCVAALCVDIDFLGKPAKLGQKTQKLYPTEEKVAEVFATLAFRPHWILRTTGGVHAYWFIQPVQLDGKDDRERVKVMFQRWQAYLRKLVHPATLDSTHDLARVFRLPASFEMRGTWDRRNDGKLLYDPTASRFDLAEIATFLDGQVGCPATGLTRPAAGTNGHAGTKAIEFPGQYADVDFEPGGRLFGKLQNLLSDPKFATAIGRNRRTGDSSASGYDMVLRNCAWNAGWSFEEFAALARWQRHVWRCKEVDDRRLRLAWDKERPRQVEIPHATNGSVESDAVPSLATKEGRTELANARRLALRFGSEIRWVADWGRFLRWDGTRWKRSTPEAVQGLGKSIADQLWREEGELGKTGKIDDPRQVHSFLKASSSEYGLKAAMTLLKSEPGISIESKDVDQQPLLLNCCNGTVDLCSGELRPHDRRDLLTKCCPVTVDAGAQCPGWKRFLAEVFPDQALRDFIQRAVGYSLTGDVREDALFVCHGQGANGKTTFLNVIMKLLGNDFAGPSPPNLLIARKFDAHPTELASLVGMRLVVASETRDGDRLDEPKIKLLTGRDPLKARWMHQDFWSFTPSHKLWLVTNHRPVVSGTDSAIWRRLKLVPFSRSFSESEQNKTLEIELTAELSGILNWAIAGALQWLHRGLDVPDAVVIASNEYRKEQDVLGRFLSECFDLVGSGKVWLKEISAVHRLWCERAEDEVPLSNRAISKELKRRGFVCDHINGLTFFGLELNAFGRDLQNGK